MELEQIKSIIEKSVDDNRDYILQKAADIMKTPETGYKEFETSAYVKKEFEKFGVFEKDGIAYTGVRGKLGREGGINICILGELDAVVCPSHPESNSSTGAAHACGHNGQMAVMLGIMKVLKDTGILDELVGKVTFMAVPAEEMIEIEYRKSLIDSGKIRYMSGKQQLIYEKEFDDVDICMMIHAQPGESGPAAYIGGKSLGFVMKVITFHGKASHAGAAPFDGVNALNAAMLSMMGMHIARETFKDEDKVRIHPIITKGGDVVNIVPDHVVMENQVRAYNPEALMNADEKAELAIKGACISTKATATIESSPGYLPLRQDETLSEMFYNEALSYIPEKDLYKGRDMIGSSDIGDVGHLIPTIQPTIGGVTGSAHSKEFDLSDKEASLIIPVKILAKMCAELLYDNGAKAYEVKKNFKPVFTREEYINYLDSLFYVKELP